MSFALLLGTKDHNQSAVNTRQLSSQPAVTCSKLTREPLEQDKKYVES